MCTLGSICPYLLCISCSCSFYFVLQIGNVLVWDIEDAVRVSEYEGINGAYMYCMYVHTFT